MSGSLNKEGLLELLDELSERLRRKKTRASIYIVGGAAMALAFDRSRTTHDIDARIDARHRRTDRRTTSTHDIDARIDARHRRTTSTPGSTRDTGHSSRQSTTSRTAEGFPRAG